MGGRPAWLPHTWPVYWGFCAARTPCQEGLVLNLIKLSQRLRAQAGCSECGSEMGRRFEETGSGIPGPEGAPSSSAAAVPQPSLPSLAVGLFATGELFSFSPHMTFPT